MFHRSPRSRAIWLFLGCIAFFAAANCLIFPLMLVADANQILGTFFVAAWYSAIGAQMALHAIWCVFVPLHWIKRFLVGATSGLVLYGALAGAFALFFYHLGFMGDEDWLIFIIGLLCLPLLLLAAQAPLWIMRTWFRWRITHLGDDPSTSFQSLRIRDLMIATAVIAMALTAAQISQSIGASSGNNNIVGIAVAALIIMVTSGILVLPVVVATLHARRLLMALALVFSVDVAIVVACVTLMVILTDTPANWETYVAIPTITGGFFVNFTTPMLIARKLGYRLQWGHQ
ncbi:MAG: hypothetical protein H8E44_05605 [Planctomycetes bacterium]|nr:hypothetical protein [Planctomycetota bacterium]MBL7037175.1 hypothetical protein [Pirellulaceae bacterium]